MVNDILSLTEKVLNAFASHDKKTAFTIAISGIDASGKGYVTKLLQDELEKKGYKVANINIDPWHNPIPVRLQKENAAENFYNNAFRWDHVFQQLLYPLKNDREISLTTKLIRTNADEYYEHTYEYKKIDFLLIDAIFLLQKRFIPFFDYKIWVDCSFDTGLKRAIARNIENLDNEKLLYDYNTYYYPAQLYHFKKDDPKYAADLVYNNDLP